MKNWLDKYRDGGDVQPNYNDSYVSLPPGFTGWGYNNAGNSSNGAWDGPVTRMGGTIPGATGMMYSRTSSIEPKKAQSGKTTSQPNPLDYNFIIDNIIKDKGGDRETYERMLDAISFHETGGTMDPTTIQKSDKTADRIGPGRGMFQIEGKEGGGSNRLKTSANRTANYYEELGFPVPDEIKRIQKGEITDATQLHPNLQRALVLGDFRMKGGLNLKDYVTGKLPIEDLWVNHWWAGERKDRLKKKEKFLESYDRFNKAYPEGVVPKDWDDSRKNDSFEFIDTLVKQSLYGKQEYGGIIKDNNGYWNPDNWGKPVEIDSNQITMKGVNQPLLGVSDAGDMQMMYPEEEYEFVGNKVTEYPLTLNGININKQSRNWLDKYNNKDVYGEQEIEKAQDGTVQKIKTKLNPKNWGVKDYTESGDFSTAYSDAKLKGEKEFMWNGKRYNTDYAGTPRQEVGSYGVKGNKVVDPDLPIQVNRYSPSKNYPPGHISAGYVGRQPSKIPKTSVNKTMTGKTRKYDDIPDQSLYIYGRNSLNPENVKPGYNFVTNNCADAVCDALSLNDRSLIETPRGVVKKLLSGEQYPSLDVTGRTYGDYYRKLASENNILDNSKYWLGIASSPDNKRLSLEIIEKIQQSLKKEGYDLPNSIKSDGYFDGVLGEETKAALKDYQTKSKKSSNKKNGGNITKAKDGKELVKLNQLTNFTNYNTPQPGGWLDKFN